VVAAGTSAPELVVSLLATVQGAPAIAVGNVVGSNIANILLILGAAGMICPLPASRQSNYRDGVLLLLATALFTVMCLNGHIRWWHGGLMLICLAAYIAYSYQSDRRSRAAAASIEAEVGELRGKRQPLWLMLVKLAGGLAAVLIGSELLVRGATGIARHAGISESVIGLTLVAVGTSLPELATSVAAARHKHTDLVLGNVIGSNIFNILAIMGTVSVVHPVAVPKDIVGFDLWVMVGVTVGFVVLSMTTRRIGRRIATVFAALYAAYVLLLYSGFAVLTNYTQ
jgi:cation:H+ antiporter